MARNCLRNFAADLPLGILHGIQCVTLNTSQQILGGQDQLLNDQYFTSLKMMILAAIPIQHRIEEASQFLSGCDPRSIRYAETSTYDSDEIAWTRSRAGDQDNLRRLHHKGKTKSLSV